jgi:hypothetical protein
MSRSDKQETECNAGDDDGGNNECCHCINGVCSIGTRDESNEGKKPET